MILINKEGKNLGRDLGAKNCSSREYLLKFCPRPIVKHFPTRHVRRFYRGSAQICRANIPEPAGVINVFEAGGAWRNDLAASSRSRSICQSVVRTASNSPGNVEFSACNFVRRAKLSNNFSERKKKNIDFDQILKISTNVQTSNTTIVSMEGSERSVGKHNVGRVLHDLHSIPYLDEIRLRLRYHSPSPQKSKECTDRRYKSARIRQRIRLTLPPFILDIRDRFSRPLSNSNGSNVENRKVHFSFFEMG